MDEVRVQEADLDALAAALHDVGEQLTDGAGRFASLAGRDTGAVAADHAVTVARWLAGLRTAAGAVAQAAAEVTRCADAYRATDSDRAVTFTGIPR